MERAAKIRYSIVASEEFKKYLAQTTPFPIGLEIEKASGSYIYDSTGKKYLDFTSGIAVSSLGHGHPKIKSAVKRQIDKHMHVMVYGEFEQAVQTQLAKTLVEILPEGLDQAYFVNSGAEANEGALKLAKRATGRREIISFRKSYHGSTHGALSVSGNEEKKFAFRPLLPNVKFLEFDQLDELVEITKNTACVIIETIQGDAGVRIPSIEFMQALRQKCNDTGTLLILDEIQCGLGRTGQLFAFERFKIQPDILTLGKALGGGMPIGAFISSKQLMTQLTSDPMLGHITTFGGHPVVCAAALAGLDVLLNEIDLKEVEEKGAELEKLLTHNNVKEIRRTGMMFAIEMASAEAVQKVVENCQQKGLLSFWFLSCPESFRIAPPLNISKAELRKGAKIIQDAFEAI